MSADKFGAEYALSDVNAPHGMALIAEIQRQDSLIGALQADNMRLRGLIAEAVEDMGRGGMCIHAGLKGRMVQAMTPNRPLIIKVELENGQDKNGNASQNNVIKGYYSTTGGAPAMTASEFGAEYERSPAFDVPYPARSCGCETTAAVEHLREQNDIMLKALEEAWEIIFAMRQQHQSDEARLAIIRGHRFESAAYRLNAAILLVKRGSAS